MSNTNILFKPEEYGKWVRLFAKYPIPVLSVLLFFMFLSTYGINYKLISATQEKADKSASEWKELYLEEKAEKDELNNNLLIKNGIVNKYEESKVKEDSIVKQVKEEIEPALNIIEKTQRK